MVSKESRHSYTYKINFKLKTVKRDKEEHYNMTKGSINPSRKYDNCKLLCIQHQSTQIYRKLTELKRLKNSSTIIVENFNTPLSIMARSSRQRINKETVDINTTIEQID